MSESSVIPAATSRRSLRGAGNALITDSAPRRDSSGELLLGQAIHEGRYELQSVLGRGSFATVYEARCLDLGRTVAIKVPRLELLRHAVVQQRFVMEAKLSATFRHPHLVALHDAIKLADGTPALVFEQARGQCLHRHLERGPLSIADTLELGRQLGAVLAAFAEERVVHRDLKPENIMVHRCSTGCIWIKVLDLGIATKLDHTSVQSTSRELIGTPQYMSTEQLLAQPVDCRADLYGAGAVLYEALTGSPPHTGTTIHDFRNSLMFGRPPSVRARRPDCPRSLEQLILRALHPEREHRQQTPEQWLVDIRRSQEDLVSSGHYARQGERHRAAKRALGRVSGSLKNSVSFVVRAPRVAHVLAVTSVVFTLLLLLVPIESQAPVSRLPVSDASQHERKTVRSRSFEPDRPPLDDLADQRRAAERDSTEPLPLEIEPARTSRSSAKRHPLTRHEPQRAPESRDGSRRSVAPYRELAQALRAFVANRPAEALEIYQQLLRDDPRNTEALRGVGLCSLQLGRSSDGARALRLYLKLVPHAADSALIEERLNRLERAH